MITYSRYTTLKPTSLLSHDRVKAAKEARRKADKKEQAEKACQTRPPSKRKVDQILREMNAWNASHPQATFLQIEEKARELVSQLEAHLIQASALEREQEEWSQGEPSQRPSCPMCQVPLLSRGKRVRPTRCATR